MIFKGNTELRLNEATMIEAIDYWLANKVWHADEHKPRVTGIKMDTPNYNPAFIVTLDSDETAR